MQTYCKDIDITDYDLVRIAVVDCLRNKHRRKDVIEMLARVTGRPPVVMERDMIEKGLGNMPEVVDAVVSDCIRQINVRKLDIKEIWYTHKRDSSSHKMREIGIQDVTQQIFDYIAVYGLLPVLRRVGEYQCAAIPGKGQSYGIKTIRRWLRNPNIKYACQCDIRKCYPSVDRDRLMTFLRKRVKNEPLLWLVETLIGTFKEGLSIGSYLSQWLCNLWLSTLYHYVSEELFKMRRDKRVRLVRHVLFYMDDVLFLGTSSSDLMKAFRAFKQKAAEMGFEIKESWRVWQITDDVFIDMMGARIYRDHATIRRRVFIRIRRNFRQVKRQIDTHQKVPTGSARKCIAYYGTLIHTDSFKLMKKLRVRRSVNICRRIISNDAKNRLFDDHDAVCHDADDRRSCAHPDLSQRARGRVLGLRNDEEGTPVRI